MKQWQPLPAISRAATARNITTVINKFENLIFNTEEINALNDYCICNNLSFGGAADLLIVSMFIKSINELFYRC